MAEEDAYLVTIGRLEPNLAMVGRDAALASIAISLKRIADKLERAEPRSDGGMSPEAAAEYERQMDT